MQKGKELDLSAYWAAALAQRAEELAGFFAPEAQVRWPNTNECFTAEEFIRANSDPEGRWFESSRAHHKKTAVFSHSGLFVMFPVLTANVHDRISSLVGCRLIPLLFFLFVKPQGQVIALLHQHARSAWAEHSRPLICTAGSNHD